MTRPLPRRPARRGRARAVTAALSVALAASALTATGCTWSEPAKKARPAPTTGAAVPDKPSKPQTLKVLDLAGDLQLTQGILDNFQKEHPEVVTRIVTAQGSPLQAPAEIKAAQAAGRLDVDLVLTDSDGLATGLAQGTWLKLTPAYDARLPALSTIHTPDAAMMQQLAQGYGVTLAESPVGPLIMYNPKTVPTPPTTADELLAYAKQHPGKVEYAQPRNSWPARALLMGLPYILGDRSPTQPETWTRTWEYLAEMAPYNPPYPVSTGQTMTDLASGTVDIIATTTGWDINSRALGTVPAEMKVSTLQGFHWVMDAHYAVVPVGVDRDKLAAVLSLIRYALQPNQQAVIFDKGYFYPGPAVKGATIDLAPADSQDVIRQFGRPEYDSLISDAPKATPVPVDVRLKAFELWDRNVGSVARR
ncbi:extracellular solute-binding protein [Planosporangium thailandense]|uniref:Extracellular solute-binding protein n=1 Tax=Planosporangium thailandense TaxID=765197 RepID=A0ABX0XXM8_9ACTN|nr:extracellular solute-binding protein [Planosporangium thailandense]NJC70801.1 extracellular solute-binding protein [Planosporangium thailandense]